MKILKLEAKQETGLLTPLHSDTIYGHFCWRLYEAAGEGALTDFIERYKSGKPVFLLSDGLASGPEGLLFPAPLLFTPQQPVTGKKKDKILAFTRQKAAKERKFVSLTRLNALLGGGPAAQDETTPEALGSPESQSLRVSVQIDRYTLGHAESQLFTYKPVHLKHGYATALLIKVADEDAFSSFNCLELIKDVFRTGFGKKKSSGYGQFTIAEPVEEFRGFTEPATANGFLVLGNYLPANGEVKEPRGYTYRVKYGKLGEALAKSDNPFKNPAVFLTAGSCFYSAAPKNFYGRLTANGEIAPSRPEVTQFGMPFSLNINLPEEKEME